MKISSYELLLPKDSEGVLLMRYTVVRIPSPHKDNGTWDTNFKAMATLRMCWCFLSTIGFCWGVSTHNNWCKIPIALKISFKKNYVPLSLLRHLTFMLNWVSTIRVNYGIKSWVSNLCLSNYTQEHLVLIHKN